MLRRNPDLIATIAVALYLFMGVSSPSMTWQSGLHARSEHARQQIEHVVKAELRSILRELALSIRPF